MNTVAKNTTKHNHSIKTGESSMKNFSSLIIGASLAIAMFATTAIGATITVNSATDVNSSSYSWSDGDKFIKQGTGKLTFDDAVLTTKDVNNLDLENGSVEFVNHRSMTSTLNASAGTHITLQPNVGQLDITLAALGNFSIAANRYSPNYSGTLVQLNTLTLGAHTLTTPDSATTVYMPIIFRLSGSTVDGGTFNVGNNRPVGIMNRANANLSGDFTKTGAGDFLIGKSGVTGGAVSGSFNITAGTVKVAGDGALTGETATFTVGAAGTLDVSEKTGGFTLASGQTLTGTGNVSGSVSLDGGSILSPGIGPGVLSVDDLTLQDGAIVNFEPGARTDTADLSIVDNWTLNLFGSTSTWAAGGYTVLFSYANAPSLTGNWNDPTFGGDMASILSGLGLNEGDLSITSENGEIRMNGLFVIPEPSSMVLLLIGGMAVCLIHRRKYKLCRCRPG